MLTPFRDISAVLLNAGARCRRFFAILRYVAADMLLMLSMFAAARLLITPPAIADFYFSRYAAACHAAMHNCRYATYACCRYAAAMLRRHFHAAMFFFASMLTPDAAFSRFVYAYAAAARR